MHTHRNAGDSPDLGRVLGLLLIILLASVVQAELATLEEARTVCTTWLSYTSQETNDWYGG